MSAYIVDDAHVDALIDIAKQYAGHGQLCWHFGNPGQSRSLRDQTETEIGRMLLGENARAVGYRYREVQDPAALTYVYRSTKREYTPSQSLDGDPRLRVPSLRDAGLGPQRSLRVLARAFSPRCRCGDPAERVRRAVLSRYRSISGARGG
jgi:hypothetical protein